MPGMGVIQTIHYMWLLHSEEKVMDKLKRFEIINQLLILEKLYPDEASEYAKNRKAVEYGFELHYSWLTENLSDGLSEEECKEVLEIMDTYRSITFSWKRLNPAKDIPKELRFDECKSPAQLKEADHYIKNFKDTLFEYVPPCVDMTVLVMYDRNLDQPNNQFLIKFLYTDKYYQEIKNTRDFGFETFWSSVGGFVGIFLGTSLLQVPELIAYLAVLFRKLKNALYHE